MARKVAMKSGSISMLSSEACGDMAASRARVVPPVPGPNSTTDPARTTVANSVTRRSKNRELGTTFLFATHDDKLISYLIRKIYLLDGRVDKDEIIVVSKTESL